MQEKEVEKNQKCHFEEVMAFCDEVEETEYHCIAEKKSIERFKQFLNDEEKFFYLERANLAVNMIETLIKHETGGLRGKPLILQPWQKFNVYCIFGFYVVKEFSTIIDNKTQDIRKEVMMTNETLIFIPRKNGKTALASAIAFVHSLFLRKEGANILCVAPSLAQSLLVFAFLKQNILWMDTDEKGNLLKEWSIVDNNTSHLIEWKGGKDSSVKIKASASDVTRLDGYNVTCAVLDEQHYYRNSELHTTISESVAAREQPLVLGITTAGTLVGGFLHERYKLLKNKLLNGILEESFHLYICEKDEDVGWDSEQAWKQANPNYGISLTKAYIENKAKMSIADMTERQSFLTKHLNIFSNQAESYFDYQQVKASNQATIITIDEAKKLGVNWVGGIDLSESGDLTAACIYARKDGIDYVVSHGFMPLHKATMKARTDGIPYGFYEDKGWLTLTPTETVDYRAITMWFVEMRKKGFSIKLIGYDAYGMYATDILTDFRRMKFRMVEIRQWATHRSSSFREIEDKIIKKQFCYFGNDLFEYCIANVKATEVSNGTISFDKVTDNRRIDLFDCAVTALKALNDEKMKKTKGR